MDLSQTFGKQPHNIGNNTQIALYRFFDSNHQSQTVFFTPQGHWHSNEDFGVNLGLGYRKAFFSNQLILGTNVFYDAGCNMSETYHQIGVGFELFFDWFDFRTNLNWPLCKRQKAIDTIQFDYDGGYFLRLANYKKSGIWGDCEISQEIPINRYVYGTIGVGAFGYQFHECISRIGLKGRIRGDFSNGFYLEGCVWKKTSCLYELQCILGFIYLFETPRFSLRKIHQTVQRNNHFIFNRCKMYEKNW